MAGTVRIEMNPAGIRALLTDGGVAADMLRRATAVAEAAGGGEDFVPSVYIGRSRARASVITATEAGREAEAIDLRLTRAIDAGR